MIKRLLLIMGLMALTSEASAQVTLKYLNTATGAGAIADTDTYWLCQTSAGCGVGNAMVSGTAAQLNTYIASKGYASGTSLTLNHLVLGNSGASIGVLAALGSTTTVLHGNAAGAPSFGAVNLSTDVSGSLPVGNLNGGSGASSNSFWRGDGIWAVPPGGGNFSGPNSAVSLDLIGFNGTSGTMGLDSGIAAAAVVTLTGAQTLTNKSIDASEVNSGTLSPPRLPLATSAAFGAVKCDGTSIMCTGGVISTPAAPIASGSVIGNATGGTAAATASPLVAGSGITITATGGSFTIGASGAGGVSGPGLSVVNNLASWNSTTGNVLKDSGIAASTVLTASNTATVTNKSISASQINSGVMAAAQLPVGTNSATGILRCDGTTTVCSGGSITAAAGLTPPASGSLYVSNGTSAPAGLAPVNNDLIYATAGTWAPLASANSGVLVTSAGGVPSISSTLPSGLAVPAPAISGAATFSGSIVGGGATGGAQGNGTINATGMFINGVAVATSSGGGVTWPASTDIVISNGTSAPAGLAPANNRLVYATGGAFAMLATAANGVLKTDGSSVPSISSTLPAGLAIPTPVLSGTVTGTYSLGGTPSIPSTGLVGLIPAANFPALTGDVTNTAGQVSMTLANTTVVAGSYTSANITIDSKGRITTAANGSGGSSTFTVAAGFAATPGTCNTGAQTITGGSTLSSQLCIANKSTSYTVNNDAGGTSDSGRLLIATGASVNFTLPNPSSGTKGISYNFGSNGTFGFGLRTVGGSATFYGCSAGAGSTAPNVAVNIDIIATDDGTNYKCSQLS